MRLPLARLALVAGVALPLAFGAAAVAQNASPPPPPVAADHHGWASMTPEERQAHMAKHQARMADHLREILQLRPDQEPALAALLQSVRPPDGGWDHQHRDYEDDASLTTPERLDHKLAEIDHRRADLVQRIAAVKTFYAQLAPAQQKAFDALHDMDGGHGMRGHHGDDHGDHDHMGNGPGGPPQG